MARFLRRFGLASYIAICGWVLAWSVEATGAEPAFRLRLDRPDRQWQSILHLFEGERYANPSGALKAWKQALGPEAKLSKSTEALITLVNPEMSAELKSLDQAECSFGWDPAGRFGWRLLIPQDDGTFDALRTALALTDGAAEDPIGEVRVNRLGRPGSPLGAHGPVGLVFASDRNELIAGLNPSPRALDRGDRKPLQGVLDVPLLSKSGSPLRYRQFAEALKGFGVRELVGSAGFEHDLLRLSLEPKLVDHPDIELSASLIDLAWLAFIPAERTVAAVALGLDRREDTWNQLIAIAERVEKLDASYVKTAPLLTRLNLWGLVAGVKLKGDLLLHLRGISALVTPDDAGRRIEGGLIALHTDSEESVDRLFVALRARLAKLLKRPDPPVLRKHGLTLLVATDQALLDASVAAADHPERSAQAILSRGWKLPGPVRAGGVWIGRLPNLEANTSRTFARAVEQSPPLTWQGYAANGTTTPSDLVEWRGIKSTLHRFLEQLP